MAGPFFEMPPPKSGGLAFGDHQKLMNWLRELPREEKTDCDQLASDRNASFYRGYVMSRRLNRTEYLNTLRDLLGVEATPEVAEMLPADGGGGEGFDTSRQPRRRWSGCFRIAWDPRRRTCGPPDAVCWWRDRAGVGRGARRRRRWSRPSRDGRSGGRWVH